MHLIFNTFLITALSTIDSMLHSRHFSRGTCTKYASSLSLRVSELNTVAYDNFEFIVEFNDPKSRARLSTIYTPHGKVSCPNFVFCGTKAAMKAVTPAQFRDEGSQIMLSNTYHLMLTPGSKLVEKMGGLQKFTNWNGPMLTDSGGYQIFSMGFGSVSDEIKGKRDTASMGWNQTLIKIDEDGATFRSYIDGVIHRLTPERSMEIQKQLGADLIVVLDECTPFNVEKKYTADSMRRSHRWALRCLSEFERLGCQGTQALYGIIQGGVYEDLRRESCDFVNSNPFFGIAIGGSLGANKRDMHDIVTFTRSLIRNDRPVHLLGIGGVRDIFHGVRQGIDTFDCVHPTRLGRHGGALVLASHWDEEAYCDPEGEDEEGRSDQAAAVGVAISAAFSTAVHRNNALNSQQQRQAHYDGVVMQLADRETLANELRLSLSEAGLLEVADKMLAIGSDEMGSIYSAIATTDAHIEAPLNGPSVERVMEYVQVSKVAAKLRKQLANLEQRAREAEAKRVNRRLKKSNLSTSSSSIGGGRGAEGMSGALSGPIRNQQGRVIREHVSLDKSHMRNDPRPIDSSCRCYTCRNKFSRAYLHHLLRCDESLGGTLVTIHNIHFMNRLMADIREGIANGNLDEVERKFVHPALAMDK